MGQVAYARQAAINYNLGLPSTGSLSTTSIKKTNSDSYADNYCSYIGWRGSGLNWWIEYENNRISDPTWFHSSDQTSSQYLQNGYRGYSVNSRLKTDAST